MGIFDAALIAAAIALTTPILLAATGELGAQRAGMINIGLEGMMLSGALAAFIAADRTGSMIAGLIAGGAAGVALAMLAASLAIETRADQIVVGIGLNILAAGLTGYVYQRMYADGQQTVVDRIGSWPIPLLSDIPFFGRVFFDQDPLVYAAFIGILAVGFVLARTNWGAAVRASGELPEAVDAAGLSVRRVRWLASAVAGLGAGLGGAFLVLGQTGLFQEQMSAGRGFLAFAAVVFGRWIAGGVLGACLLFGGADALQLRLQNYDSVPAEVWWLFVLISAAALVRLFVGRPVGAAWLSKTLVGLLTLGMAWLALTTPQINVPSQLWLSVPYLCALVALAGLASKSRMPTALGLPYKRGD